MRTGVPRLFALPFAFPSFDDRYSTAYVSANGFVSFASVEGEWTGQRPIPYPGGVIPGGVIAPFWMLLDLDDASAILSAETTVDGMPAVTIEWRNVFLIFAPDQRLTFSTTLVANGDVLFSYGEGVGADADRAGWNASVGIEAEGSEVGAQYSRYEPVLEAGRQIRFTRDERAWLTGYGDRRERRRRRRGRHRGRRGRGRNDANHIDVGRRHVRTRRPRRHGAGDGDRTELRERRRRPSSSPRGRMPRRSRRRSRPAS